MSLVLAAAVGVTGALVPLEAAASPRVAPGAAPTADEPVDDGSVSEEDEALALAKSTGQPAELAYARTELSDTWALPDGSFSIKRYGSPVRLFRDGVWVPTDPSLVFAADGTVVPKASTVSVAFSGGGTGPLLSGVKDGRTLTLSWPTALPKPVLDANVATYSEVLPGVDLQLKAEVEGFSQLIVVKTADAAKNPALATLKYKMNTVGLSVASDPDTGSLAATDPAGQTVFTSPTPLMWDSSTVSSAPAAQAGLAEAAENPAPGDTFEPPPGAADAQMPTTVSGDSIEIKPDQSLLTDARTTYPVYLDPSWAWGKKENWTRVYKQYPSSSFWNSNEVARVGYEAESGGSNRISRSFFQLDTDSIKGTQVKSSTFRIRNVWSWSCQSRPVEVWHTGPISKKTNWNNQPGKKTKLATVNDSKGWSKDCAAGNLEFDVTDKAREAAAGRWSSITLGMYAQESGDGATFGWKKFDAKTAVLETKYNNPPKTPYGLGTNPKTSCAAGGLIGNTAVSVYATVDDPDAGNLTAEFQVFKSGSTSPIVSTPIAALKHRVSTLTIPNASLPSGSYTWKVRARDGDGVYSSWSPTCKFSLDRTRPGKPPIINSTAFPNGDSGWPKVTGKARTPGAFTIAANGVTDAVQYGWYTDHEPQVNYIPVAAGETATVTITPPGYGPHFAYAFSIDKAGNRSDTATYIYYATRSAQRDAPGDLNGDGLKDIWSVDSNGTLLTYAGQQGGEFSSATNGGQAFDDAQVAYRTDWGSDGYTDLVTLEGTADKKTLWTYPNNGLGIATTEYKEGKQPLTVKCPVVDEDNGCVGEPGWTGNDHWNNANQIIAPGDINEDGKPDLLVQQGKLLWAYFGDFTRRLSTPVLVGGSDWDKYTVIAPGDLNNDKLADLWLRDKTTGDIFRTHGSKGPNGLLDPTTWGDTASRVKIANGYPASAYPTLGSVGDFTGDGIADLWARKTDNTMLGWPGKITTGTFSFSTVFSIDGITGGTRIPAGTTLNPGQSYSSRSAKLTMRDDGNLEITSNANKPLWSTKTSGNTGAKAVMQPNGNLVVYKADGSTVLWQSGTQGKESYALLQDRGNLVVYNAQGHSQWSSGTVTRHDYNGDGRSDLGAWYTFPAGLDATHTLLADSTGKFAAPVMSYKGAVGQWTAKNMKFVTGDFNGDGRGDTAALVSYSDTSLKLWTWLSKADGGFAAPVPSWSVPKGRMHTTYMTPHAGDFNGDGRDDIAVWYAYPDMSTKLWTYTSTVKGTFNAPFESWSTPTGYSRSRAKFVTGDFNGDGRDDLSVFYNMANEELRKNVKNFTFRALPTGGFAAPTEWWATTDLDWNLITPHAGDFSGDGRDDALLWYDYPDGSDKASTILAESLPDRDRFGSARVTIDSPAGNWDINRSQLVVGDYDGDGQDDLGALDHRKDGTVRTVTWTATPAASFNPGVVSWTAPSQDWLYDNTTLFNSYN